MERGEAKGLEREQESKRREEGQTPAFIVGRAFLAVARYLGIPGCYQVIVAVESRKNTRGLGHCSKWLIMES